MVLLAGPTAVAQLTSETDAKLREMLRADHRADTDENGVLTAAEAAAFRKHQKEARARQEEAIRRGPKPTMENVAYGPHERNVFDFWKVEANAPTPLVIYIHGGAFVGGDKRNARRQGALPPLLEAGVSVAAINYRLVEHAPIHHILRDAARAVQFLRYHASKFHIDTNRVGAFGESAGAGTSVWLGMHDDLADPNSSDPVLRESSRLQVVGSIAGQFSYDTVQWDQVFEVPLDKYHDRDPRFYRLGSEADLHSETGKRIRSDVDLRALITRDDPPVFLISTMAGGRSKSRNHIYHHPKHSQLLKERLDEMEVPSVMYLPAIGSPPPRGQNAALCDFFLEHLQ